MNQDELIEALIKFTEQTGMEWESMFDNDFRASNEFCVVFTNVQERSNEETELELDKQFLKVCKQMQDEFQLKEH